MGKKEEHPKLFISYSWSNTAHEQWVINLASQLRESGVDVILDKWDLREGHDALAFMEKMVTDPEIKKVVIISDRIYSEKADGRSGGVGTETQIISPKIYEKADQNKFVVVISEKDENGKPYLPTYYKSRVYIDLSNQDVYASNFEQLLRWVYDKPLYVKPEIGEKPSFISEVNPISLETTTKYRRALDAIRNNKEYTKGALGDFLTAFSVNLEKFRITDKEGEFDEKVVDNIGKFLPYRNEAIELFLAIAQYYNNPETIHQLHKFFENLITYMKKPESTGSWSEWDFDNFKFIIHELFLYLVAILLKYECFSSVSNILSQYYYVPGNSDYGKNVMVPFYVFWEYLRSIEHRNDRLKLRRLSLHADLLEKRSKMTSIAFLQLMQADFVLFIQDIFETLKVGNSQHWWPVTLVYLEGYSSPFEIFARAQSKEYFDKLKIIFNMEEKDEFLVLFDAFESNKFRVPRWDFSSFYPKGLLGFDKLATRP